VSILGVCFCSSASAGVHGRGIRSPGSVGLGMRWLCIPPVHTYSLCIENKADALHAFIDRILAPLHSSSVHEYVHRLNGIVTSCRIQHPVSLMSA